MTSPKMQALLDSLVPLQKLEEDCRDMRESNQLQALHYERLEDKARFIRQTIEAEIEMLREEEARE